MNRVAFNQLPLETHRFNALGRTIRRGLFALFVVQAAVVWARLCFSWPQLDKWDAWWPDGLLVVLATATSVASLTRQLPGQNVIVVSLIIAVIGAATQSVGVLTGIPFGPYVYTERMGQQLFYPLPWSAPMVWVVAVLASRGVARLVLRPWRKGQTYGFQLIGLATLLVVLFDVALEPFATKVKQYWHWNPTKIPATWYSTPWVNFAGWAVTALVILAFVTPWLLNKKPVKHPPDYQPLWVWGLLNLLFLTGAALHQLWAAAGLILAQSVLTTVLAVRGAKEQKLIVAC